MAQTGFTPLKIYASATAGHTPSASNLINDTSGSELAINITDGKLFYKDNTGTVQVIATKASTVNVASFSGGTTGLTPNTATTGAVTLAGTLAVANGGTGVTTSTGTGSTVLSTSPTLVTPVLGTPTSGNLANCTFPTLNQNTTGTAAGLSTTLVAASGGTGLSSPGTSGNLLTSNGTAWTSSVPAATQIFGSTWTNYTGTKTSFTTYTNSTGKFIQAFCNSGCNGGGDGQIYINGNLVARWSAQFNGCGGYSCNMAAIIPPGATYYISSYGTVNSWWELV